MKNILGFVLFLMLTNTNAAPATITFSDMTTAAATGYCLAKHPYRTIHKGQFTPDGYEIVSSPGVVGAVRRNFIYDRSSLDHDEGNNNASCQMACSEFGKPYNPSYTGVPLLQQVSSGDEIETINSGIGDLAAGAGIDKDFYLDKDVVAGMWSRGNTWHESDVAQADFCCCQVK